MSKLHWLTYRLRMLRPIGRYGPGKKQDDTSPKPVHFLKPTNAKIRDLIKCQFSHIDKGCLSDPPSTVVNIFRYNAASDQCYVAHGTNTNERDNFDLVHKILSATHIGIHRAERLMYAFFEQRNHSKSVTRLGTKDHGTHGD
jgi:hypothetical protein